MQRLLLPRIASAFGLLFCDYFFMAKLVHQSYWQFFLRLATGLP
ncbi:hypothetical protein PC128_g2029 [Phytophthora cactorum]|nr:hypothetical protein PC128_g2029 [Phytophthora cactorum]